MLARLSGLVVCTTTRDATHPIQTTPVGPQEHCRWFGRGVVGCSVLAHRRNRPSCVTLAAGEIEVVWLELDGWSRFLSFWAAVHAEHWEAASRADSVTFMRLSLRPRGNKDTLSRGHAMWSTVEQPGPRNYLLQAHCQHGSNGNGWRLASVAMCCSVPHGLMHVDQYSECT